jgi:HlyD family secretion protein
MSIRDTSAQDRPVATASGQHARKRRQQWLVAGIAVALLLMAGWLVSGWASGSRSFDASRVRIAEVKRGDLVRDISAEGRVIAANNPTLYAIAGGTVTLHVVAGDAVTQGQALAEIDSPELRS